MKKPEYTKEEKAFIKEWGVPSELEFDTKRVAYTGSGKIRITSLFLAKQRKKFFENHGKNSDYGNNF